MSASFPAEARDSLSNLAASLNAGRDKVLGDAFFIFDLDRSQVEAMYRGDWLARKIVDIVPYDMVREWRVWSGERADVAAAEAAERRFGVRKLSSGRPDRCGLHRPCRSMRPPGTTLDGI